MKQLLVKIARRLTAPILFWKRLPSDLGGRRILVTSRADIRMLAPGLERSAGDLFRVVRSCVAPNDVVWDIGSNLGILTFCSSARVGSGGKVYSLEADPRYADIQMRTLKQMDLSENRVSVLCAAVANQAGILDLIVPVKGHARNHLGVVEGNSPGEAEVTKQVVTLTLDWLLDYWDTPNFVKIDVEGAELLAIQGAKKLFTEVRPVAYIECSPENSPAMTSFFMERDYRLFRLSESGAETEVKDFEFNTLVRPAEKCRSN